MSPKPKAPRWLTEAFRDGVDERDLPHFDDGPPTVSVPLAYAGAHPNCWLADHDPVRRPCSLPLERFHFIPRQRVENALGGMLLGATVEDSEGFPLALAQVEREAIVLVAAWDPRNGGLACEGHHRRYDGHAVSLPRDRIIVPAAALPAHVNEFVDDYGLLADYFGKFKPPYVVDEP